MIPRTFLQFLFHAPLCHGVLLVVLIFMPMSAFAQEHDYVESLVRESVRRNLHEERAWRALLHFGKTISGTYKSKIDDKKFFNSPEGRFNSQAELEATLRSFFTLTGVDGQGSACRFPARYAWLAEQLQFDPARVPATVCSERDTAFAAVEAKSAVLVFPVGHINSPASMFGHTLIRIDGSSKSNLISYAVNYAAENTDTNGFSYAWKGLTGRYKGYYSLMPYYDKVREYNDLEHRDMWEYRLNLTAPEVRRMLDHIWELQKIESSYYFLDENCSYNLMFLLEVARPELHLTDRTGLFVLPSDTVRIVTDTGIVEEITYRASQGTKLRKMMSLLDPDGGMIARDISYQKENASLVKSLPVPIREKIKILDLATGFVQYRFNRKEIDKETYSRLYLAVLRERSALGAAPEDLYQDDEPDRPDAGHGSTKISLAAGVHAGELFGELNIRPEFHGLLDPDQGYLPGAQIKFLDTAVRYGGGTEHISLQMLQIIDILSIAPRDIFFKPLSWKINTGFAREILHDGAEHLVYRLNSGGGFAHASPTGGIWYALAELDVNAGPEFRAGIAVAPGFSVGGTEQIAKSTKCLLNLSGYWYGLGDDRSLLKASLGLNQRLTQNNSLSLETSWEKVNRHFLSEASVRWNFYY